jgi:hypothetical protein
MNSYIRDSSNNYVIYLDQGSTFDLEIKANTFGLSEQFAQLILSNNGDIIVMNSDNDNLNTGGLTGTTLVDKISDLTFAGTIKQSQVSLASVDFTISKNVDTQSINLHLSSTDTSNLNKLQYSFDVFYKDVNNSLTRAFGGTVIINKNLTKFTS